MIKRYIRQVGLGLRILLPKRAEARYAKALRQSGGFDRAWYRATNPRLPWLCRWLPERHYVLIGERAGLCPNPDFSPLAYRHLNPDQSQSGLAPFAHYLARGRAQGRKALAPAAGTTAPAMPEVSKTQRPDPPAPQAVVLHLYYPDLWEEISGRLKAQRFEFDLFVTLTANADARNEPHDARIRAAFPGARIWHFPNHGRDILPFLHLVQSGILRPYRAVCKLHTKKSPHLVDGDRWRRHLLDGVLGAADQTRAQLETFVAERAAGIWVADGERKAGPLWLGPNGARLEALCARAGIVAEPRDLVFAAGSIYWIKQEVLGRLAQLALGPGDFEPEIGQVDGTTAHALERLIGLAAHAMGREIRESQSLSCRRDRTRARVATR